jgi:thioredoxin reductase (NADPH)
MCQAAYQIINPGKKYVLKYTTVAGVDGFDGTRKKHQKQWLRPLFNILNKSNKKYSVNTCKC